MEPELEILVILLSIFFGILFFVVDYFERMHPKLNISIIAGVAVSYFFLVLLPESIVGIPEGFRTYVFEFVFILIGFSFIHITEKMIFKKIEKKEYKRMKELLELKNKLEDIDRKEANLFISEIDQGKFNNEELKKLSKTLIDLNKQVAENGAKIKSLQHDMEESMSQNLNKTRLYSHYAYHLIIGLVMVFLLVEEFIFGVLFFLFAWLKAILTIEAEDTIIMEDLTLHIKFEHNDKERLLLASAAITGVIIAIILELTIEVNLEIVYFLFSFIAGVIFYTIVREVIPETEKGNSLYFVLGVVVFSLLIIVLRVFTTVEP